MVTRTAHEKSRWKLEGRKGVALESIAAYCMVSPTTVRRWILEGRLSATKLPSGHCRVSVADFRDFLRRHAMPISEELEEE